MAHKIRHVYVDTEFLRSNLTRTGLVSLALTDDDGVDYYAVNRDMDAAGVYADGWMRDNVWPFLPHDPSGELLDAHGAAVRPYETIRDEVSAYFANTTADETWLYAWKGAQDMVRIHGLWDHDWGVMPSWIPQWFFDLRGMAARAGNPALPKQESGAHHPLADARHNRDVRHALAADTHVEREGLIWHLGRENARLHAFIPIANEAAAVANRQWQTLSAEVQPLHEENAELRNQLAAAQDELREVRANHDPRLRCLIVKAAKDRDLYIGWSNVAEAPAGMWTRAEALAYGFPTSRLDRADTNGSSNLSHKDGWWDDWGFIAEQRGLLDRANLAEYAARYLSGQKDAAFDLLRPLDGETEVRRDKPAEAAK